jgi:hypothetical protein
MTGFQLWYRLGVPLLTVGENCLLLIGIVEGLNFTSVTSYPQGTSSSREVPIFRSCKNYFLKERGMYTGMEWAIWLRIETRSEFW